MERVCEVLVVEDDADIGVVVRDLLDMEGYRVTVAADYREAAAALAATRFDFVLLDTPGAPMTADRWEAMARLRELAGDTPVALFTAHGDHTLDDYAARGFHAVLRKPFDLHELIAAVSRAVPDECAPESDAA